MKKKPAEAIHIHKTKKKATEEKKCQNKQNKLPKTEGGNEQQAKKKSQQITHWVDFIEQAYTDPK